MFASGIALVRLFKRIPPRPNVSVIFTGFTNDSCGTRLGTFRVTNNSDWPVQRDSIYFVQRPTGESWRTFTNSYLSAGSIVLQPQQFENLTVPAPAGEKQWRLSLSFRKSDIALVEMMNQMVRTARQYGLRIRPRQSSYASWSDAVRE